MGILATQANGGGFSMIIIFVVLIAVMYFIMIRPQNKEKKRMQAMLAEMEPGDAVVTTAGFYGVVKPMDGVVPYRLEMQTKAAQEETGRILGDLPVSTIGLSAINQILAESPNHIILCNPSKNSYGRNGQ